MEPKNKNINSFYEQEIQAVLGIPPRRLILLGNSALFLIVSAILAYIFLVKHPVTYQAKLTIPEQYQADTLRIDFKENVSSIKKIYAQDRQIIEKGAKLFDFLDTTGTLQSVFAPSTGKLLLLQQDYENLSKEKSKHFALLLKQPTIQQFQLPIATRDIDLVTVGQEVIIFSPDTQASGPGIIQSIYTQQNQFYAMVTPMFKGSIDPIAAHYQLSFTVDHETIFDKFFNQKK